jgi:DME family drug/metabolite transporter
VSQGGKVGPILLIMTAAALWGLIGPVSVWGAREGLTATQTAFWRTALAAIPFALLAGGRLRMPRRTLGLTVIFGVAGIATMYVAFFIAVQRAGPGVAAVLLYTGPAWVAIYEWIARGHRPAQTTVLALLLTIAGVVLVSFLPAGLGRVDVVGIIAALISGMAYSTHYTLGRRLFSLHAAPAIFAIAMAAAALVIAPIARPDVPAPGAWPPLLYLALIATFLTSLLFARGVVQVAPVRAAIVATIEPVVALIATVLLLNATFHWQQLAGAALVLIGVTLVISSKPKP